MFDPRRVEQPTGVERKKKDTPKRVFLFGGPEESRTPDPYNANVVRSQLRYRPVRHGSQFRDV